jgi:hypothetical protein
MSNEVQNMTQEIQDKVRELAYLMWESAGRQQGMAMNYWLTAEKDILNTMQAAAEKVMPTEQKTPTASKAVPAKAKAEAAPAKAKAEAAPPKPAKPEAAPAPAPAATIAKPAAPKPAAATPAATTSSAAKPAAAKPVGKTAAKPAAGGTTTRKKTSP